MSPSIVERDVSVASLLSFKMRYLMHAGSSQKEIDASELFAHLHGAIEDHAKELCAQYSIYPVLVPMSPNLCGAGRLANALHK